MSQEHNPNNSASAAAGLSQSECRLLDIIAQIPGWVWETDTQGILTYVSSTVTAVLGYAPEDLLGRPVFELMTAAEAQRLQVYYTDRCAHGQSFHGVLHRKLHRLGHEVLVETSGVPLFDAAGQWSGCRGLDRVTTEHRYY
ncbi:MAG: PAS domain S-box protein [Gammaproteobacteria bacterium]